MTTPLRSTAAALAAVLGAAAGGAWAAGDGASPAARSIEVLVEVPPSNFVYRQGSQLVFGPATPTGGAPAVPYVFSPGVGIGPTVGINLVANAIASGVEAAAAATAREAVGPVGDSIQDIDLRATVFELLRTLAPQAGPSWAPSPESFPAPEPPPSSSAANPGPGHSGARPAPDPIAALADRAARSEHEQTLLIRVLPLFRGLQGRTYVSAGAMLFDKSGQRLAEWNTQLMGPVVPDLERPQLIGWWAERRYRQFLAHGLRAVLAPMVEEIADPALRAQRLAKLKAVVNNRFDEAGRVIDPLASYDANARRMYSTLCVVQAEQPAVIYRYERTRAANQLVAAAYCPGEKVDGWDQRVDTGMSWIHEARTAARLVTRAEVK